MAEQKVVVHVVHGNMNLPNGEIHPEYQERIDFSLTCYVHGEYVALTGGQTRKGQPAEAENGLNYLLGCNFPRERIILENGSKTTGENIMFLRHQLSKLGLQPKELLVYHRPSAIPKTKVLYKHLWPGVETKFIPGYCDMAPLPYRILDRSIFWLLAHLDPYETGFLWRSLKRIIRNPQA